MYGKKRNRRPRVGRQSISMNIPAARKNPEKILALAAPRLEAGNAGSLGLAAGWEDSRKTPEYEEIKAASDTAS